MKSIIETTVRQAWKKGNTATNGWIFMPGGAVAEVMAHSGYDALCLDLQHGQIDLTQAVDMLRAIQGTSVTPLFRSQSLDPDHIGRLLDAGFHGVICPLINSATDAQSLVEACRYPPQGRRSYGPMRAALVHSGNYLQASKDLLTFAMVETRAGLEQLEAILETEGLTGIYLGPGDLAMALGLPPRIDSEEPELLQVIADCIHRAREAGKHVGMHCHDYRYALRMRELGADLITVGSDQRLLQAAARQAVEGFRKGTGADATG